jgi:CSLREA domain-containing protein
MRGRRLAGWTQRSFLALLIAGLALAGPVPPVARAGTTIVVDTTADIVANDGQCSLREAITAANTDASSGLPGECPAGSGADTITLAADATYTLAISGQNEDNNAAGDLDIRDSLTFDGQGATIDANYLDRALHVVMTSANPVVEFDGVTLRNGRSPGGGGAILCGDGTLTLNDSTVTGNGAWGGGGGIYGSECEVTLNDSFVTGNWTATNGGHGGGLYVRQGSLILNSSTVKNNIAGNGDYDGYGGGGIYFESGSGIRTLTLDDSVVSNNHTGSGSSHCSGPGGGIWARNDAILVITNSTIHNNYIGAGSCGHYGGGIYYVGSQSLTVTGSTLSDNASNQAGGGMYINTTAAWTIANSTVSGNTAADAWDADGGGIYAYQGSGTIENSTIADNDAYRWGGGMVVGYYSTVYLKNTLLAENSATSAGPDCYRSGTLSSQGYNLLENTGNCSMGGDPTGNITGQDPHLNPLADNGGPTRTHALRPGSPAIDAGNPADCPVMDQRGEPRPVDYDDSGSAVGDIGAFELQGDETASLSGLEEGTLYSLGSTLVQVRRNTGSADPGTMTVTKYNQPPGGGAPDEGEMPVYWNITADTGSGLDLDLILCYTDWELGSLTESSLAMYRRGDSGWTNMGGAVDPGNNCVTLSHVVALSRWTLATEQPTAVTLSSFTATPTHQVILLEWETASEIDSLGFHLYRGESPEGDRVRLNVSLIPCQKPGSPVGAAYTWHDAGVTPGILCYYWLEEVDVQGAAKLHGPVLAAAWHQVFLPLVVRGAP